MPGKHPASPPRDGAAKRSKKTTFRLDPANPGINTKFTRLAVVESEQRRPLCENAQFSEIPRAVLNRIEEQFKLRFADFQRGQHEGFPEPSWRPFFTINNGATHLYPETSASFTAQPFSFSRVDAANTALLGLLLDNEREIIDGGGEWRELDTTMDINELMPNPGLLALHGLRRGDVGYHFDKHGCLAVCLLREGVRDYDFVDFFDEKGTPSFELVPRDYCRLCFFVEAKSGASASSLPLAPVPKEKFSFSLKKAGEQTTKEGSKDREDRDDGEDVVAQVFYAGKEKEEEEEKRDWEEQEEAEREGDFGGLRGFY